MQDLVCKNILEQNENLHPGQPGQKGVWRLQRDSGVCWKTGEVWSSLSVPTTDLQPQMTSSAELPEVCLCSASTHSEELNTNTFTTVNISSLSIQLLPQLLLLQYVSHDIISFKLFEQKPEQNLWHFNVFFHDITDKCHICCTVFWSHKLQLLESFLCSADIG